MREVLKSNLSEESFKVVQFLFRLLAKVAAHSDVNKMNASNLGICWGPTLFRGGGNVMAVIQTLINNYEEVFLIEY
jgi:hypothetical protein